MVEHTRLLSFNTRGLRDRTKRKHLFHILRKRNYDFIMLQEVHCTPNDEKMWRAQWGADIYFSHGSSSARGVLILVKRNLNYQKNMLIMDDNG